MDGCCKKYSTKFKKIDKRGANSKFKNKNY
jgi:hypothetical protein